LISRIDHVAIAVKEYEKARHFFQDILGAVPGAGDTNHKNKMFWQIFSLGDLSRLELIYPTEQTGFLAKFLENKKAGGLHHLTLQTPDIKKAQKTLENNSIPYFGYDEYRGIWKEIFIHPKDAFGVLIQIAEFRADDWVDASVLLSNRNKWSVTKTENGCKLSVAHPGGVKVTHELTPEDIKNLIRELEECR
jgi:methylmalonyl-CoA/ethylmalonyl-CoA epimerase